MTQSSPAFNISQSFATLPASQIQGETYKRLYHNLAYLLKTRGTERGIKALVTTFGIPGDILTSHEYGGYDIYKVPGIQEISNTKIITGSVLNISSSLLSPYTTLQYYQNNTDKSSNDIQVAFSPADSINASITSSTIVTGGTPGYFNIMQLIGAPNLQYSSSYTPLVQLADTYFNAEYTSRYNVWDFIRVIKYYNNSVFKMLRDWVPARSSASTGVVIQSHMLERNKYPRHEPTFTNISGSVQIKMVSVTGSDGGAVQKTTAYVEAIPVQYSANSFALSGSPGIVYLSSSNNVQKYTGEFSGSSIQADYTVLPQEMVSSYNYPWTSSAPTSIVSGNILFLTYSVSPTYQNITASVLSQRFLDLDYNGSQLAPTNYGLITQSIDRTVAIGSISQSLQPYSQYAQVQDYNYYLPSTVSLRYSGSYLQGKTYNTWSVGDISYANDAVINYYSDKLGFFTQIQSSSFIPNAVNATLGYLADVSGGLFELNQNNKHWTDVQNIFVAGTTLTVKQFDNKKYSNQVATDGIKTIYNSGYNYTPELYFNTLKDSKVYFEYVGTSQAAILSVQNQSNFQISGSSNPRYLATNVTSSGFGTSSGYIYNIFDYEISDTAGYYLAGDSSINKFPTFSVPFAGVRTFNANLSTNVEFPTPGQEVTYSFTVTKNSVPIVGGSTEVRFKSQQISGGYDPGTISTQYPDLNYWDEDATLQSGLTTVTGPFLLYRGTYPPIYVGDTGSYLTYGYYDYHVGGTLYTDLMADSVSGDLGTYIGLFDTPRPTIINPTPSSGTSIAPIDELTKTLNLNISVNDNFAPDDIVSFQLLQTVTASAANFTASVSIGSLTLNEVQTQGSFPYASSSVSPYITALSNSGSFGYVTMSADISNFYEYQQIPYFVSGGTTYTSSLYERYGDVNVPFLPQPYDKLILEDVNGIVQNLDIYSSSFEGNNLVLTTVPNILPNWILDPTSVETFLLLKRYDDEQNVIITFTKPAGQTSYGFIIPETINPSVTANINTLQATVQSQLLSNQANTNISTV